MTISEEMSVIRLTAPSAKTVGAMAAATQGSWARAPGRVAARLSATYMRQHAQMPEMSEAEAAWPACAVPYMSSSVRRTL